MQSDSSFNKTAFVSKKVCYKVSLCVNCQQQSCNKAFTGLSNRAQMIGGSLQR